MAPGSGERYGYGGWPSPLTAAAVTAAQNGLGLLGFWRGRPLAAESRPDERGRSTLLALDPAGGPPEELTPAPFNLRTRVNEYGGRAWAAAGEVLVAVDDGDQRLHRLRPGPSLPLTPAGADLRFADMALDLGRGRLVAVMEDHRRPGEPETLLAAVPLDGSSTVLPLVQGHDFFAYPRLSPDGRRLAWIAWDHPAMPWDGTTLFVADLDAAGLPLAPVAVAGGIGESVLQPEWTDDGALLFLSDRSGFWSLYEWRAGAEARRLWERDAEMGYPLWQLGMRWYAPLEGEAVIAAFAESGLWRLVRLSRRTGEADVIDIGAVEVSEVVAGAPGVLLLAGFADRPAEVRLLDPDTKASRTLRAAGSLPVAPEWIGRGRPIAFASEGGRTAHAIFYPPTNPDPRAARDGLPPLIVRSHGGPTSAASPALRLAWQFWTSRGFALVDVDYAGSTGYGRAYREALNGAWGIADVEDCCAAARHCVEAGLADPARLAIAGNSAGGYTTLAALTFADTFKAGASHYGIGDLEALARDTHKFESRYLDTLVGPWPEAREVYEAPLADPPRRAPGLPRRLLPGRTGQGRPPGSGRGDGRGPRRQGPPRRLRPLPRRRPRLSPGREPHPGPRSRIRLLLPRLWHRKRGGVGGDRDQEPLGSVTPASGAGSLRAYPGTAPSSARAGPGR